MSSKFNIGSIIVSCIGITIGYGLAVMWFIKDIPEVGIMTMICSTVVGAWLFLSD